MAASSDFECYLCGSHNEPDASFCVRCNGQLLHIPSEPDPAPAASAAPAADRLAELDDLRESDDSSDNEAGGTKRFKSRRGRTVNLEDQRLSDALGLTEEVPEEDEEGLFAETVVTSIPRATQSSDIPLLGTRPGVIPQSAMSSRETGRKTYVLLALLLVFTGWFGYNTITRSPLGQPDSIAFVSTTSVAPTTTTTTVKPPRQWKLSEVQGRYNSVFVTVTFFDCDAELQPGQAVREPVGEVRNGIILSTNNVVVDGAPAGADVAEIRNRTGQRRNAIVDRTLDGLTVVTSTRQTPRHLSLEGPITDQPKFYVGYDPETNIAATLEESNREVPSEVLVTATGDVHSARLDGRMFTAEALSSIDIRYEIDPDAEAVAAPTVCTNLQTLRRIVPEGVQLDDSAIEPTDPDDAISDVSDEE